MAPFKAVKLVVMVVSNAVLPLTKYPQSTTFDPVAFTALGVVPLMKVLVISVAAWDATVRKDVLKAMRIFFMGEFGNNRDGWVVTS